LRASQERYAVTLASIGDGVVATDDRGAVSFMNPMAETLTGWPAVAALGRPVAEVLRVQDGTPLGRDGRPLPIPAITAPLPIRAGAEEARGGVIVFRDVTERRRAEEAEALRLAHERLELALRGSQVGVWDYDVRGAATLEQAHLTTINIPVAQRWHPDDRSR